LEIRVSRLFQIKEAMLPFRSVFRLSWARKSDGEWGLVIAVVSLKADLPPLIAFRQ
jgi:hypothetical protein